MRGPRVVVYEGTRPRLRFRLKRPDPDKPGATTPYTLVGATVAFNIKTDPDDFSNLYGYSSSVGEIVITDDGTDPSDKYSEVEVQCNRGVPNPGTYFYHIVVTVATIPDIVTDGIFEVVNI